MSGGRATAPVMLAMLAAAMLVALAGCGGSETGSQHTVGEACVIEGTLGSTPTPDSKAIDVDVTAVSGTGIVEPGDAVKVNIPGRKLRDSLSSEVTTGTPVRVEGTAYDRDGTVSITARGPAAVAITPQPVTAP